MLKENVKLGDVLHGEKLECWSWEEDVDRGTYIQISSAVMEGELAEKRARYQWYIRGDIPRHADARYGR